MMRSWGYQNVLDRAHADAEGNGLTIEWLNRDRMKMLRDYAWHRDDCHLVTCRGQQCVPALHRCSCGLTTLLVMGHDV